MSEESEIKSKPEAPRRGQNVIDRLIRDGHAERAREAEAALLAEELRKMRLKGMFAP